MCLCLHAEISIYRKFIVATSIPFCVSGTGSCLGNNLLFNPEGRWVCAAAAHTHTHTYFLSPPTFFLSLAHFRIRLNCCIIHYFSFIHWCLLKSTKEMIDCMQMMSVCHFLCITICGWRLKFKLEIEVKYVTKNL